jgi:HlyD family secretion protein
MTAILAVLVLLVIAFLPRPVQVEVAPVVRGPFQQVVEEDGKTRARERYVVSAPLAGHLLRIQLKEGDPIKQGGLLAVMVPGAPSLLDVRTERELQARLGAAEAERLRAGAAVERAKAALDQARADFERTRQLAKEGLVSPAQMERDELGVTLRTREWEAAQFEDHVAEHQVELARAALLRAQQGAGTGAVDERLAIRSPVPGRVLRVLQESEGMVALGTPLLEIADPSDLEVVVDVLTTDAVQIQPGMPVRIERYGAEVPLEGRVRLIEPSAFTKISALGVEEQRVNVVIDITSSFEQWKTLGDGYRVEARIIFFSEENTVKIPISALFREGDQWAVFVLSSGRAQKRIVQVGRRSGGEATADRGLEPGEQVIIYPSDAVKEGVRVKQR